MVSSDVHNGLLVFETQGSRSRPGFRPPPSSRRQEERAARPTSVGFTGQLTVLSSSIPATRRFPVEAPPVTADFAAASAGSCVRTGERRLADGDILTVDGRHQTYVIEAARSNLFVLQASIALDQAPLSVEYDSSSHAFVGCSATGDGASRIQMIATLLRKLDCDAAFDALVPFLDHPDFFVRWHVMRELLGLDASAALPHLRRMAEADPHPDPRRTAKVVLDRFGAAA